MVGVAEVAQARDTVARVAAGFEAALVTIEDAERIVGHAAAMKHMAATIESLAAARAAAGPAWRQAGFKTPAEWLASKSGSSVGKAKETIETGKRLESQPATAAAARAGALSAEQTAMIADAAAADPSAEEDLVEAAGTASLTELRNECLKTKSAADPNPEATHQRIHGDRRLRFFTDPEGAANVSARTTVDQMAPIKAAVDDMTEAMFTAARIEERREPREAYAMDALAEICTRYLNPQPATTNSPPADRDSQPPDRPQDETEPDEPEPEPEPPAVRKPARRRVKHLGIIRVDLEALRRGITEQGETCEIAGLGPIPVATARDLLGDAALHLVITRGVDVANVTSLSRSPSMAMRIALHWLQPTCSVAGCNRPATEIDHRHEHARGGPTTLANLDRYCDHHHDLKTYKGWVLVPGTGRRPMVPPDNPLHPDFPGRPRPDGSAP